MPRLLTIDEAAAELGVPPGSLRTAAEKHGFLVMMGRARRIDPSTLPELIRKCRNQPVPRDRGHRHPPQSRLPATPPHDTSQRALQSAAKLKRFSHDS